MESFVIIENGILIFDKKVRATHNGSRPARRLPAFLSLSIMARPTVPFHAPRHKNRIAPLLFLPIRLNYLERLRSEAEEPRNSPNNQL